jgi:hypothetical protein
VPSTHRYYYNCLQEEIGEVFEQWQNSRKPSSSIPIPTNKQIAALPRSRRPKNHDLTDWSEGLLAEFNSIIAQELSQLEANNEVTAGNMRLRITRSRSWDNNDTDASGTPPSSPTASDTSSSCSPSLHHRALGLARVLRRQRSPLVPGQAPGDAVLVKVSSLPDADVMYVSASDTSLEACRMKDEAPTRFPRSDSGALVRLENITRHKNSFAETPASAAEDVVVSKVKQSRYTPLRRLGGEEVYLLLIHDLGTRWG